MTVTDISTNGTFPITCIAAHEISPEMTILYVSSSVRHGMGYEPQYVLDNTLETFLSNDNASEYRSLVARNNPGKVIIAGLFIRSASGILRFIRLIHFNCDDIALNIAMMFPDVVAEQHESTPLDVSVFSPNPANTQMQENGRHGEQESMVDVPHESFDMGFAANATHLLRNRAQNHTHYARTSTKACLILEGTLRNILTANINGPKVLFASRSLSRIIDIDPSDVQGLPFLSLVATEDTIRAASFLEKMATPERIVLDNIKFLAHPLDDTSNSDRHDINLPQTIRPVERSVTVEVLGAGSDDGAIILFQLNQPQSPESRAMSDSDEYMSLEDIISSDPDTSDVSGAWRTANIGPGL